MRAEHRATGEKSGLHLELGMVFGEVAHRLRDPSRVLLGERDTDGALEVDGERLELSTLCRELGEGVLDDLITARDVA